MLRVHTWHDLAEFAICVVRVGKVEFSVMISAKPEIVGIEGEPRERYWIAIERIDGKREPVIHRVDLEARFANKVYLVDYIDRIDAERTEHTEPECRCETLIHGHHAECAYIKAS